MPRTLLAAAALVACAFAPQSRAQDQTLPTAAISAPNGR